MKVKNSNGMFRCDEACCKNFSCVDIMTGGVARGISLCSEHFLEMLKSSKELLKSEKNK